MSVADLSPGWFVAIVGPSGAGKDTLLRGAENTLSGRGTFNFPRRTITRSEGDDNEDHIAISNADFIRAREAGEFCVSWSAHGLHYGISKSALTDIAKGKTVVANVSRASLTDIRALFPKVRVVQVNVDRDILAERLRQRGRESEGDIASRLSRMNNYSVTGADVATIDNSGAPAAAIAALVDELERLAL